MPIPASIVLLVPRRVLRRGGMGKRAAPSGGGGMASVFRRWFLMLSCSAPCYLKNQYF
jgi:hypothetical protein